MRRTNWTLPRRVQHSSERYKSPNNEDYQWAFGFLCFVFYVLQVFSGLVITLIFNIEFPNDSVIHLIQDIDYGWWINHIHKFFSSAFIFSMYGHMHRSMYYKGGNYGSGVIWRTGVLLFITVLLVSFSGYTTLWGQMSLWAGTIFVSTAQSIPFLGKFVFKMLVGHETMTIFGLRRIFSLHLLLGIYIFSFMFFHVVELHDEGSSNPVGLDYTTDMVEFKPYDITKNMIVIYGVFTVVWFVLTLHAEKITERINYIFADPDQTPAHIIPEWYFLPWFAALRCGSTKVLGLLFVILMFVLLWKHPDFWKPLSADCDHSFVSDKVIFHVFVLNFVLLGVTGALPPTKTVKTLSLFLLYAYYIYFWLGNVITSDHLFHDEQGGIYKILKKRLGLVRWRPVEGGGKEHFVEDITKTRGWKLPDGRLFDDGRPDDLFFTNNPYRRPLNQDEEDECLDSSNPARDKIDLLYAAWVASKLKRKSNYGGRSRYFSPSFRKKYLGNISHKFDIRDWELIPWKGSKFRNRRITASAFNIFKKQRHYYHMVERSSHPIYLSLSLFYTITALVNYFSDPSYGLEMFLIWFFWSVWIFFEWVDDVVKESLLGNHTKIVQDYLKFGFRLFIFSEILFFASFFWAFFYFSWSADATMGGYWPGPGFWTLGSPIVGIQNTFLLFGGGFAFTWTFVGVKSNEKKETYKGFFFCILYIFIFLFNQLFEFASLPFSFQDSVFGSCFFMLTGLHFFHALLGFIYILTCFSFYLRKLTWQNTNISYKLCIWYWHFVDFVWVFVFYNLYWLPYCTVG